MATEMLQYLDPDGLDETVLNIGQIKTILEGQINDLGESIEEEMQDLPYARPDGLYPDMTVGAVIGADETSQWATRESTGSGAATVRSVKGATIGYNQLVPDGNFTDATKWRPQAPRACSVTIADNTLRVTVIDNTADGRPNAQPTTLLETPVVGHKYLIRAEILNNTGDACSANILYATSGTTSTNVPFDGEWHEYAKILTCNDATSTLGMLYVGERVGNMQNGAYVEWRNYTIIDLTQMFGAGNEPTTVAEFEAMYPESYYPYSTPTLKPVRIAGIESTDANGDALDSVEWESYPLRAAGSVADMLYSDHVETRVGVVDLGTLTWTYRPANDVFYALVNGKANGSSAECKISSNTSYSLDHGYGLTSTEIPDNTLCEQTTVSRLIIKDTSLNGNVSALLAAINGTIVYYELETPTTTPISPALPMTYRVEQGGTESIIVPDGEISAAPVLTVAEPVNMSTELARIWAAIESLGYTRNTAQLSRPISLTDVGSVDEVQKDTTDIETTKEVQE